jgi:homoserine O-acetyltransferase
MMRKMLIDAIRNDPDWRGGDYAPPPVRGLRTALAMLFMMTSSPIQQQKIAPTRDAADAFITKYVEDRLRTTDANDMLYAFDASRDYDPSPKLESIRAAVLAINSADDVVNPPELGLMEQLIPRVKRARYVLIPTSNQTRGHGTHSLPAVWKSYLGEFLQQLP